MTVGVVLTLLLLGFSLSPFTPFSRFAAATFSCRGAGVFDAAGHSCFYFHDMDEEFDDAQRTCEANNSTLAILNNGFDNSIVVRAAQQQLKTSNNYWLGGKRDRFDRPWMWLDNSTMSYEHWANGEPVFDYGPRCLLGNYPTTGWTSDFCNVTKPFVCLGAAIDSTQRPDLCGDDKGWLYWSPNGDDNGHCYFWDVSFYSAIVSECDELGSKLASIHSAEENEFIYNSVTEEYTHPFPTIGLNRVDGRWQWVDGTPLDYTNWAQDEPTDNENATCVQMYRDEEPDCNPRYHATWNNIECGDIIVGWGGVCKKPAKKTRNSTNFT